MLTYLVPITIETARAQANNLVWHGRYTLPFAVGIPIIAGFTLRAVEGSTINLRRFAWWLGTGFVIAQVLAFGQALRRYTTGVNGPVFSFWSSTPWSPPVPSWLLLAGYFAVMIGLVIWVLRSATPDRVTEGVSDGWPRRPEPSASVRIPAGGGSTRKGLNGGTTVRAWAARGVAPSGLPVPHRCVLGVADR